MDTGLQMNVHSVSMDRVYEYLDDGYLGEARSALDEFVQVFPRNTDAWEIFFQLCETKEELDDLYDRAVQSAVFSLREREVLLESYIYLRQRIVQESTDIPQENMIVFQLVDQFNYPTAEQQGIVEHDAYWMEELPGVFMRVASRYKVLFYLALLVAGLRQVANGNYLGYWLIMGLVIAVCVHLGFAIANLDGSTK